MMGESSSLYCRKRLCVPGGFTALYYIACLAHQLFCAADRR